MDLRLRGAFTLTELLAVLWIVAFLMAMLLPVFHAAREAAHGARCSSDLKQFSLALSLYADDWGGCLPAAGDYGRDLGWSWVRVPEEYRIDLAGGALWFYTRSAALYRCPSDDSRGQPVLSYALDSRRSGAALDALPEPASAALLIEEAGDSARGLGLNDGAFHVGWSQDHVSQRHGGGGVAFADGHVRRVRSKVGIE